MGYFRSGLKFTKKSVIYWVGDGINNIRIIEGSFSKAMKTNPNDGGETTTHKIRRSRKV